MVPPRCKIPRTDSVDSSRTSRSITPRQPFRNPTTFHPMPPMALRTTARMAPFSPGQSPPPVRTPMRFIETAPLGRTAGGTCHGGPSDSTLAPSCARHGGGGRGGGSMRTRGSALIVALAAILVSAPAAASPIGHQLSQARADREAKLVRLAQLRGQLHALSVRYSVLERQAGRASLRLVEATREVQEARVAAAAAQALLDRHARTVYEGRPERRHRGPALRRDLRRRGRGQRV